MKFDAIAFDFDGVLVESIDVKDQAFFDLYCEFGQDFGRRALAHHEHNRGVSRYEKLRYCHKEFFGIELDDAGLERLAQKYSVLVETAVVQAVPVPGAIEFLREYSRKLPLYVLSATPHEELLRIVENRAMGQYFKDVFGYPHRKDDMLRAIVESGNLDKNRLLMVGDALSDWEAAKRAGVSFVGRRVSGSPEFPSSIPVVDDLFGLPQWIT